MPLILLHGVEAETVVVSSMGVVYGLDGQATLMEYSSHLSLLRSAQVAARGLFRTSVYHSPLAALLPLLMVDTTVKQHIELSLSKIGMFGELLELSNVATLQCFRVNGKLMCRNGFIVCSATMVKDSASSSRLSFLMTSQQGLAALGHL